MPPEKPDSNARPHLIQWAAGITAFLSLAAYAVWVYPWMLDDAFITFRYAVNLADGHGLVYNVGERVEGCTTFLWTLLLACGRMIGLDVVNLSKLLASVFAVGTILLLLFSYRFISAVSREAAAVAAVLLATSGLFAPWPSSGMEVNQFVFLSLLALLLYIKATESSRSGKLLVITGAILALAVMTRPDGALLVLVLFGHCLYRSMKSRSLMILSMAIPAALLYLPYYIWRTAYYGYLLPNTFFAKVGYTSAQIMRGLEYVGDMAVWSIPLLLLSVIGVANMLRSGWRNPARLFAAIILTTAAYTILVGGDCMPAFRFLVPTLPLLCLLAGAAITRLLRKPGLLISAVSVLCAYNVVQTSAAPQIMYHIQADHVYLNGKEAGLWLKANCSPETVIATNTAGSIPYYSGFKTIDMLGMNDEHIAHKQVADIGSGLPGHEKGDGNYVLAKQPDIIQFGSSLGAAKPKFPTDEELFANPGFHQYYRLHSVTLTESGKRLLLWVRTSQPER